MYAEDAMRDRWDRFDSQFSAMGPYSAEGEDEICAHCEKFPCICDEDDDWCYTCNSSFHNCICGLLEEEDDAAVSDED